MCPRRCIWLAISVSWHTDTTETAYILIYKTETRKRTKASKYTNVYKLGLLKGLDFPGSRKNFPFPGKKIPHREIFGKLQNPYQTLINLAHSHISPAVELKSGNSSQSPDAGWRAVSSKRLILVMSLETEPPPPTLTLATMPWRGGEVYTHGDCLQNDRRVAAVKIRQHWHWNNSALYSRSPDIDHLSRVRQDLSAASL